jgi:hypothetical protein
MKIKPAAPAASSEKRGPGWTPIRRGLRPHLRNMSSNAAKLYLWLHLSAEFSPGPRRGLVEQSYEDIARAIGWSRKKVQRTVGELLSRPYIEVVLATNQHDLTRIKILKYDPDEASPAVDKSVHGDPFGVDTAVDRGVDKCVQGDVHSSPPNGKKTEKMHASKNVEEGEEGEEGEEAAKAAASLLDGKKKPAWKAIDSVPLGSTKFQLLWEQIFAGKAPPEKLSDAMECCIAVCNQSGITIPKPFYNAKRVVEAVEKKEGPSADHRKKGFDYLPSMPPIK